MSTIGTDVDVDVGVNNHTSQTTSSAQTSQQPPAHSADVSSSHPAPADDSLDEYGDFDEASADQAVMETVQVVVPSTSLGGVSPASQQATESGGGRYVNSAAAVGPSPAADPATTAASVSPAAADQVSMPVTSQTLSAAEAAVVVDDDGEDDFGDFDAAPAVSSSSTAAHSSSTVAVELAPAVHADQATAGNADSDEFGDFDEASGTEVQEVAAPAVPQQPSQQPAAAAAAPAKPAVVEAPDILQLSGSEFLSAVLDAWQVLGAPAGYQAAVSQQPYRQNTQQQQPQTQPMVTVTLPPLLQSTDSSSILAHDGLPLRVFLGAQDTGTVRDSNSSSRRENPGEGLGCQELTCSSNLDWQGSAAETRLVEGLGLTAAVQRALAQQNKTTASPQRQQQQSSTAR